MNEIPLTEKTMWTLPEGFTGTFAEAPKEDAPLYDKEAIRFMFTITISFS